MTSAATEEPGAKFHPEPVFHPGQNDILPTSAFALTRAISCAGSFELQSFDFVMLNLIQNPNVTSSYLFRADIFYDSENDAAFDPENTLEVSSFLKHMKAELRPWTIAVPGWRLDRLMVRNLVPRNPLVDKHLVQTCLVFTPEGKEDGSLVIYIPHIREAEEIPFYHPRVRALAFLYERPSVDGTPISAAPGRFTLLTSLYESNGPFEEQLEPSSRLGRTLLKLLQVVHKHSVGVHRGYQKRVHHDRVVPQKRFQDTYTALKARHAKHLVDNWQEVTDPAKHVFEDLGIAAFLIELWKDMYDANQVPFPGFVDIGCGNGVLTYILTMEGYSGRGFDARARNSWAAFPEQVRSRLEDAILIPWLYLEVASKQPDDSVGASLAAEFKINDGRFKPGTFIISNHADELTVWTPVLASLSQSPFLAIPCCSHNLAGERFRAPVKHASAALSPEVSPPADPKGGKTGSLQALKKATPSQYATLCAYVEFVGRRMGFQIEQEVLRIPSTRNTALLGRRGDCLQATYSRQEAEAQAVGLVEEELRSSLQQSAEAWVGRAKGIACSKKTGH